ncbi:Gfo/Idh/MocA family protein [Halocatena salina]|uniref:Gfo/Idh/MocA family oxidoreductase n=1 Tax=Halocatena salina TaxID=2934340 RepID=A0A8U0A153_9EURY|nr:Gfo/Idh/MocA family oxidoreductase [Halocatena salina]UPM42901.1 Gfo/Idh/MocA family oxidoreductase [Halocatena salina]
MVLRTAVIGAGIISGKHLSALRECPNTTPVAVCDLDEKRAGRMAKEHKTAAYTDIEELLAGEQLHWLHICTPVQTHVTLAQTALAAGIPVLIEKPITMTNEELQKLVETADANDVTVSPVHNHMFDPAMRKARTLLEQGVVGELRGVDVTYTGASFADEPNRGSWTFELPGGEFEEGIPHPLYLALVMGGYPNDAGEIDVQTALTTSYENPFTYDTTQIQYRSETGTLCSIRVSAGEIPVHRIDVHGSDGSLVVDLVSQTVVPLGTDYTATSVHRARNNLDRAARRILGTATAFYDVLNNRFNNSWETERQLDSHYYQIDAEASALIRGNAPPVPIEQAEWVITLMEQIRDEAEEGAPLISTQSFERSS